MRFKFSFIIAKERQTAESNLELSVLRTGGRNVKLIIIKVYGWLNNGCYGNRDTDTCYSRHCDD